ncbi:hypothetical protein ACFE04_021013 [Oxalis oulophora]
MDEFFSNARKDADSQEFPKFDFNLNEKRTAANFSRAVMQPLNKSGPATADDIFGLGPLIQAKRIQLDGRGGNKDGNVLVGFKEKGRRVADATLQSQAEKIDKIGPGSKKRKMNVEGTFPSACKRDAVTTSNGDYIDVVMDNRSRCTGFYGNPIVNLRGKSWELLRGLSGISDLPWLVGGNFKEILNQSEKSGGLRRLEGKINNFRQVLHDCNLQEVTASGPFFTWKNNISHGMILEKLDRVVANDQWRALFPNDVFLNLVSSISDHCPVLVNTNLIEGWHKKNSNFKFENYWADNKLFLEVVKANWCSDRSWDVKVKQQVLSSLLARKDHGVCSSDIQRVEAEINELLVNENKILRQRAKNDSWKEIEFRLISMCVLRRDGSPIGLKG